MTHFIPSALWQMTRARRSDLDVQGLAMVTPVGDSLSRSPS
ncbi:Hypothetical protein A7982_00076 [Minicystis rosea]|nr:Hypothetical protein A7982_00076 [Minicystis rosea]